MQELLSFVTPYWSGREMMRIHLGSIRTLYPKSPILVSKRGGEREEMEAHRAEFGVEYWLEDCDYIDALLRLLDRCSTEYVCIIEHDTALLSSLDTLLDGIRKGRWDVVGMEERVRDSVEIAAAMPSERGWWRFAPGQMSGPLLMFNWRAFKGRWGLSGVRGRRARGALEYEYDHGIGQKLTRHQYLLPYHTGRYGMGNVLMHDRTPVLWHQWYGAYRARLQSDEPFQCDTSVLLEHAKEGEAAFIADYPELDFSSLVPAWGPGFDVAAEQRAVAERAPGPFCRGIARLRDWRRLGIGGLASRAAAYLGRRRRIGWASR